MAAKPKNIDEYLAALSADKRTALEKLRRRQKSASVTGFLRFGFTGVRLWLWEQRQTTALSTR